VLLPLKPQCPSKKEQRLLGKDGRKDVHSDLNEDGSAKRGKLWSEESMVKAIEVAKFGRAGVNRAARKYDGIPKTTLKDRLSGKVQHCRKPGPKPYLSSDEKIFDTRCL